jgi:hypothetical protein
VLVPGVSRSLSALGDVIAAHKTGSSHVPYRNSKLTFLLKDSLGGDAKVTPCLPGAVIHWFVKIPRWVVLCFAGVDVCKRQRRC